MLPLGACARPPVVCSLCSLKIQDFFPNLNVQLYYILGQDTILREPGAQLDCNSGIVTKINEPKIAQIPHHSCLANFWDIFQYSIYKYHLSTVWRTTWIAIPKTQPELGWRTLRFQPDWARGQFLISWSTKDLWLLLRKLRIRTLVNSGIHDSWVLWNYEKAIFRICHDHEERYDAKILRI